MAIPWSDTSGYRRKFAPIVIIRCESGRGHGLPMMVGSLWFFMNQWSPANDPGPPETKGVVRVKVCEGKWLFEPEGITKTRATYYIYTDSGGALPSFIANHVSVTGISRLFAAIRKQVKDPKYAIVPPASAVSAAR